MNNNFKIVVPAELEKAQDGSWRVRGLASTGKIDQQGEVILQKGVDLTPIDKKRGVLNWDHNKGPENTIGVLDGYKKTDAGLYIEGRLFKNHTKAKAVKEIMESLGEGDRGRMGLSVEGKILERDPSNPAIIRKCQISAVALTMNPVNSDTYADILKSVNASQEVEFDAQEQSSIDETNEEATFTTSQVLAILQKALSVGGGYTQAPASLSGGDALATESLEQKKKKKKQEDDDVAKGKPAISGPRVEEVNPDKVEYGIREVKKYFGIKNTARKTALHWMRNNTSLNSGELHEAIGRLYKSTRKIMSADLYKSSIVTILDKLQVLYPQNSRSEIWEAVKGRLETKFPELGKAKGIRIHQHDPAEREHKLYEDARQRGDYEENKDKSRAELHRLAEQSGAGKHDKAKIRAQADAAKQVGDRDHVRPGVRR